jgi:hypothetical protein
LNFYNTYKIKIKKRRLTKKIKMNTKNLLLLIVITISCPVFAQEQGGKNMFKINLPGLLLGSINGQYERQIAPRITVALGYSTIPKSALAFKGFISNQIDDASVKIEEFKLGTSIFTPEVRFYVGKHGAFRGFYLAPYARIGKYEVEGPVSYTSSTNVTREAYFTGKLNSVSGGLMLGSNFRLSSKFYLDWWIIGASIGSADGNFITTTPLTPTEQTALKQQLDRIDIPSTKIQSQVNATGATVTTNGTMAGIRGLGLNLGFRF